MKMILYDFFDYVLLGYNALVTQVASIVPTSNGISHTSLPRQALFPGPWEEYIKAPAEKSRIRPKRIFRADGSVSDSEALVNWQDSSISTTLSPGGLVTLEFAENIAGLPEFVRGAFKYLTIYIPEHRPKRKDIWSEDSLPSSNEALDTHLDTHQKHLNIHEEKFGNHTRRISISSLYINCTAFPSNPNPRAYTGYFASSSSLLNRIWYSGAYTLQLTTIDPAEGSALIDFNRQVDNNTSPQGSWYNNFTIGNGTAITTDGAKRDRMAYPGDMAIAVPGIAVSTYDMVAVRTALDSLFIRQYADGGLPYAGPPMGYHDEFSDTYHLHTLLGVWNYILYTDDVRWLQDHWGAYLHAFEHSLSKVDLTGLFHVTSNHDWLRPGMTGHNLEATSLMYHVLQLTYRLADEIIKDPYAKAQFDRWKSVGDRMERGMEILWCEDLGLYGDNVGRRGCGGSEEALPQDGNSWVLISGIIANNTDRQLLISQNLRKRWTKYGAPATEFPNVISPFASSFELLAHCAAGNHDAAVELTQLMWGYMLDGEGFTNSTCVEGYRIDGDIQYPAYWSSARNSHAHGWSTGPTMVLLTEILGVKLETPLGRKWTVEPHLTKWLKDARGGFATRLGRFEIVLRRMRTPTLGRVEVLDVETPRGSGGKVVFGPTWDVEGGKNRFMKYLDHGGMVEMVMGKGKGIEVEDKEGGLVEDEEWVEPEREEWPVGVVDWKALEENYVTGP
ncbi:MAG: hypothetical protein LQ350_000599 [Teloschistes chrysophthalmus]|nr:MAG: hypothetical protein LQ350_000599 [Niorma chrysophthalma]